MLNNQQIKLVQTAVRAAGLRSKVFEGRYRFLLSHYTRPDGRSVTSCKQLTNIQLEDLLAICESFGWRHPGKPQRFHRDQVIKTSGFASYAQREAIKHLAGDLGWSSHQLEGMIKRMTKGRKTNIVQLSPAEAYNIIEALKAIISRDRGTQYTNLKQVQDDMEGARDGKPNQVG